MRRGLITWLLVLALGLAPVLALAQAEPRLQWDHDGYGVSYFDCAIDAGTPVDLGLPTRVGTTYTVPLSACGTMTAGTHSLVVRACNNSGTRDEKSDDICAAAAPIKVVKL